MKERVTIYLEKNIFGNYFVSGKYFYKKVKGDIDAGTPYTLKEKQFWAKLEKLNNLPLDKIKAESIKLARDYGFIPDFVI
jgi:hypothetical protein